MGRGMLHDGLVHKLTDKHVLEPAMEMANYGLRYDQLSLRSRMEILLLRGQFSTTQGAHHTIHPSDPLSSYWTSDHLTQARKREV